MCISNMFPKYSPVFYWSAKQIATPPTHAIGSVYVAVGLFYSLVGLTKISNAGSHSVYTLYSGINECLLNVSAH